MNVVNNFFFNWRERGKNGYVFFYDREGKVERVWEIK